jgi:hypothetical protein
MITRRTTMFCVLMGCSVVSPAAYSCSVYPALSNVEMVKTADAIVRAVAVEYSSPPSNPRISPSDDNSRTGTPDSRIRFNIIETIRGTLAPDLILPGYLVDWDDFNNQRSPYTFVRPSGRHGNCYAHSYRSGGQFLLFLQKTKSGELIVNWYGLAPLNEQLHSDDDPWLLWVREQALK